MTDTFDELEEGDRILFSDRKRPLIVTDVSGDKVLVDGPQGGEYMLFRAEDDPDTLLVAAPGNRQYASYVEDLRVVGEWKRIAEGHWEHSDTGASVRLETTDAGFWTIVVSGLDADVPKYGFTTRDIAVEEAEGLMDDNPEG